MIGRGPAPTMNLPSEQGTVLVVDDEPDHLRVALEMLRGYGLELVSARDGAAGLLIAARLCPDLILLDIRMPGLDGFEVCRRLQADPVTRPIPVLFLSALGQIEDKAQGFALGAVDYITKPFDARELLLRVATHLRLARRGAPTPAPPAAASAAPPAAPATGVAGEPARALETLLRARDLLLTDLAAPPDLTTLARRCASNHTTLEQLFQTHLGLSVFGYLREQRLQQARRLLEAGGHSVEAVSARVGYGSARNLARAFRQRFGLPPGAVTGQARTAAPRQQSGTPVSDGGTG